MGSKSKIRPSFTKHTLNMRSSMHRGKMLMRLKGEATIQRRNAFLDMNAAVQRASEAVRRIGVHRALGIDHSHIKTVNVEYYVERHREAVNYQIHVKNNLA